MNEDRMMSVPPDRTAAAIDDMLARGAKHEEFIDLCEREYTKLCAKNIASAENFIAEWVADDITLLAQVFHLACGKLPAHELGLTIRAVIVNPVLRHAAEVIAEKGE